MKELECEIKRLEDEIDFMLKKSFYFKLEKVKGEKIYELEKLRARVIAKSKASADIWYMLLLINLVIGFFIPTIWNISMIGVLIYLIYFVITLYFINKQHKRRIELDSLGIALIDMLLERKKNLESGEENGN